MKRRLTLDSITISIFTTLSVIAGLAIDVTIAAQYGLSAETDAYFVAITLPVVILTTILASGHGVLVVAIKRSLQKQFEHTLFASLLTIGALFGIGIAVLGTLLSPWLVRLLSLGRGAEFWAIAIPLSQIFFWRVPAAIITEIIRSSLNARKHFAVAAAGYGIPGLIAIALIWFGQTDSLTWVAWSMVIGSWIGLAFQIVAFKWLVGASIRPKLAWHNPHVQQVGRELRAPLAGLIFRQFVTIAERWFGSFLPEGSIAALGYASKITQISAGVLLGSITTAGIPSLTDAIASNNLRHINHQWRPFLHLMTGIAFVLGIGWIVFGQVAASLLPRIGIDTSSMVDFVFILTIYSIAIIPLGPFRALQTYFYAARQPAWVALLLCIVTIVTISLDWFMINWIGAAGLGLSFAIGVVVASLVGFWLIRYHTGHHLRAMASR